MPSLLNECVFTSQTPTLLCSPHWYISPWHISKYSAFLWVTGLLRLPISFISLPLPDPLIPIANAYCAIERAYLNWLLCYQLRLISFFVLSIVRWPAQMVTRRHYWGSRHPNTCSHFIPVIWKRRENQVQITVCGHAGNAADTGSCIWHNDKVKSHSCAAR